MKNIALTVEQERVAAEIVALGRYRDVAEVAGVPLENLKRIERRRADLLASTVAAELEGERVGFTSGDHIAPRGRAAIERLNSERSNTPASPTPPAPSFS